MKPKFRSLIAAFAPFSRSSRIVVASFCAATSAYADQTWTGTTNTDWNTTTNWSPETVPGAADIAIFDSTSIANLATSSTTAFSVKGVRVISPSAGVSIALPVVNKVAAAALTVDFATDTFTYAPATPLANGDFVTFGGTMPAGLAGGFPYFVVNATPTTFMVSFTQGGTAVDFTTTGTTVTATGGYSSVAMGTSGIDLSLATQNLNISAPVTVSSSQSWNVATAMTLTVTGAVNGAGSLTKSGLGNLLLTNANNLTSGVSLSEGQLTVRNGVALGLAPNALTLANGTTFRIEATNGGSGSSVFVGNPLTVATASSATMTSSVTGNGYGGLITGDAASTFNVGGTVAVSYSLGASTQQFGTFLGRVEVLDGATARFSQTSGVNNGGAAAIWDTNLTGTITSRNTATVNLGSLVGSGTLSGSSGADGTCTFSVGGRSEDCTFDGSITSPTAARIGALTKVGTATLTLTSATGLTYTGATNVNAGTLKITGVKSGGGSTTVKTTATLAGTGSIAGSTTVQSGGTLAPGDGGTGTLTFPGTLSLSSGSILKLSVGSTTASVSSTGTLNLASGATVDVNGFGTDGTYTIINTATGAVVTGIPSTALTAVNGVGGKIYTFDKTPSAITMTVSSTDPTNYWNVDGDGTWNLAGNWTKNAIPNPIAKVGPGIGGAGGFFTALEFGITLDANQTIGTFIAQTDNLSILTINPGILTPGTLSFDNGATTSILTDVLGDLVINVPVAVDAEGLVVDVAMRTNVTPNTPFLTTLNGVVSGSSAALTKSGPGTLVLAGNNTYGSGTIIGGGNVNINSAISLGDLASAATFSGGTLQLANALTGITRSYLITGGSYANIDTNGFDLGYDGVISPVGGGTGGLTKSGAGIMTLSAVQTYTGPTAISGGLLIVGATSAINAAGINAYAGGSIHINGGSFITTAGSSLTNGSDIVLNSGTGSFAAVSTPSNAGDGCLIGVNGGTFTASSVTLHRTYNAGATLPTTVPTDIGFVVTNGTATVSGGVTIGTSNSSASALVSGGSLTVGGQFTVGNIVTGGRYCTLQVTGGTFTSMDAVSGVVLSTQATTANSAALLVNGGTSTIERLSFGDNDSAAGSIGTLVLDGATAALYMGAPGIVLTSPNAYTSTINLNQGTLGAKASWSSSLPMNLTGGAVVIKAADVTDASFNITLSGALGGAVGFEKIGGGTLTLSGLNTHAGTTLVSAGNLAITGDSSGSLSAVTVANGATLSGSGNIGGSVTVQSGGHQAFAVAATLGAQITRTITGVLDLQAGNILDLTSVGPVAGGVYILATATGGITGDLGSFTLGGGLTGTPSKSGNNLILTVVGSAYATWASGYGLQDPWLGVNPALDGTPGADPDNDGIKNELEFALGGNPTLSSTNVLPTLAVNATNFVFTFNRADASEAEVALTFQSSTTLASGSWTPLAIGAVDSPGVVVAEGVDPAPDVITVTIAKGANTTLFGRLQAVK